MRAIFAMAGKDLRLLIRDKAGFFFTFIFPLLFAMFFGAIFSGSGGGTARIRLVVVDEDASAGSRAFVAKLQQAPELQTSVATRQEAVELVRRGRVTAYVVVTPGFGQASIFSGQSPRVELGVDPSRKAEAGMLEGVLTKYAAEKMQEAFSDPAKAKSGVDDALKQLENQEGMPPDKRATLNSFLKGIPSFMSEMSSGQTPGAESGAFGGFQPLKVDRAAVTSERRGPRNPYEISFPQGIIWGVMGCAAAFGISLVFERSRGTLVRLRTAPLGRSQILAGKGLACFVSTLGLSTALIVFAVVVFGVRPKAPLLLVAALLSISTCFVGIMMLLSVVGRTERAAGGIGWAVLMVMAMLGGGMVPLFFMPAWMQTISHASPVKWSILAMEGAIWRGFSPAEMLLPCAILLAVGVVFFAVGSRAFRWTEG